MLLLKNIALIGLIILAIGCHHATEIVIPQPVEEPASHFVTTNYIELDSIYRISKFRSGIGHNYSDDFEHCRSMKHYFEPKGSDWTGIKIFSPVEGIIDTAYDEWAGTQIRIRSLAHPDYTFIIFHVNLVKPLLPRDTVHEAQLLGHHIGSQTMSDIAVGQSLNNGWKLVSYFDVMKDSLFAQYKAHGVFERDSIIISKEARDHDSLGCNGETFSTEGTIENWVVMY